MAAGPLEPLHPLEEEWDAGLRGGDPLSWPGYAERTEAGDGEAVLTGRTEHYALIEGRFEVLGGTMGAAAGERVVRAYARATEQRLPVVVRTRTGGARVQEGMVALVQLARTAAAARHHGVAGLLSVAVHESPTTGGVLASYGSLVDLRAAVAGATIGFAGPRVAEAALGRPLPTGSHRAEAAFGSGLVDAVVDLDGARRWVEVALGLSDAPLATRALPTPEPPAGGGAWAEVLRSRAPGRPSGIDHAAALCSSWTELHGADPVMRAGLATVAARRCVVVAMDRHALSGRPGPAAYRLAQRAIALAGKLRLPLITFVDTPGADPSTEAEAGGLPSEIARTFADMDALASPSVAVCVGEGGSGGALALGHADRLLILRHAIFSVIAPEGAAAILERDPDTAPELSEHLGLTSCELLGLGIVDSIVEETPGALADAVVGALDEAVVGQRNERVDRATARWLTRTDP